MELVEELLQRKRELRRAVWEARNQLAELEERLGEVNDRLEAACEHVWVREGYDGGHGDKVCEVCGTVQ